MKIYSFLIMISLLSYFNFLNASDYEEKQLVGAVFSEVISNMEEKYHMQCFASGGAMMDSIKSLKLSFDLYRPIQVDEAREILVDLTEIFLNAVNQKVKIHPYLANYPFLPENLNILICFSNLDGSIIVSPEISSISLVHGEVLYKVRGLESSYGRIKTKVEPYAEAKKIVQQRSGSYEE